MKACKVYFVYIQKDYTLPTKLQVIQIVFTGYLFDFGFFFKFYYFLKNFLQIKDDTFFSFLNWQILAKFLDFIFLDLNELLEII